MLNIQITSIYSALLTIVFIILSLKIIRLRKSLRVGVGDGGHKNLAAWIRIHANFGEYVPLGLLLLLMLETQGQNPISLHVLGIGLFIGRLLHIYGLSKSFGVSVGRFSGMSLTFLVLTVSSILLLIKAT